MKSRDIVRNNFTACSNGRDQGRDAGGHVQDGFCSVLTPFEFAVGQRHEADVDFLEVFRFGGGAPGNVPNRHIGYREWQLAITDHDQLDRMPSAQFGEHASHQR